MARYYLLSDDGGTYSADAGDYFWAIDATVLGDLVRSQHPWRTVTGHTVLAPRLIKRNVTVRDLRRIAR